MKLVAVAALVLAISAGECRKAVVNGPKTKECPEGRYTVVVDDAKTPPELSYSCEKPAPSSSPSPAASPSPSPIASPSPSPVASPSPSPIASPSASPSPAEDEVPAIGPDGNYPLPARGSLPKWFDVPPTRVGLGDEPKHQGNGTAQWHVYLFHATPKDKEPRCPHKPDGNPNKEGECEQWSVAADAQAERGEGPIWWFAEYPGTSCGRDSYDDQRQCGVERPSRECTPKEKEEDVRNRPDVSPEQARSECARPNAYVGRDRVGAGGGPEGVRTVCVAPHGRPAEAQCRRWELTISSGWSAR